MLDLLVFLATVGLFGLPLLLGFGRWRAASGRGGLEPSLAPRDLKFRLGLALAGLCGWLFLRWYFDFYVDRLWWTEDARQPMAFWTIFWARWGQGLVFSIPAVLFVGINLFWARRRAAEEQAAGGAGRVLARILGAGLLLMAFRHGMALGEEHWREILLYRHQVPFGLSEPIFGRDAGFYVFSYPFLKLLADWGRDLVLLTIVGTGAVYLVRAGAQLGIRTTPTATGTRIYMVREHTDRLWNRVLTHLSILGALLLVGFMFETRLATWGLLFSTRGAVFGPGYTDVNVLKPAYILMMGALGLGIILLLRAALAHSLKATVQAIVAGFVLVTGVWVLGLGVVPTLVQRYRVSPNETTLEIPYIRHNLKFTRHGFALTDDRVEVRDFPPVEPITRATLEADTLTLSNVRLWDWRALEATYDQNQSFRQYYDFHDVDIDRYQVGGRTRQVMLALRELNQASFSENAATWVNLRQVYTHGYGLCLNPTNEVNAEGLPNYWVRDIPPVSTDSALVVRRPEIYYGELTTSPVYVRTGQKEFDYPRGDENVYADYSGAGGIAIGSGFRRLALAMRLDGIRQLTSADMRPDSKLLLRREVMSRLRTLAPFLAFDDDPYVVLADGRLYIMADAYTTSRWFPYSERTAGGLNYIRNSVKATVDCYEGTVRFYIFDETDPLIQAWARAFPTLFSPQSELSPALRAHIRYPEDLLAIQARTYATYHMTDPLVFYNKEDRWAIARENAGGDMGEMLPYYAVMKLPGESREEFVQLLPFTPYSVNQPKNNMVAWMAGRCDGSDHGRILVYRFPKQTLVYGPMQVEARIDQDANISKDLTLWNQQGSSVIRGNLIVLPLVTGLLYTEPIFLQATHSRMPEMKRVVVASQERLGYGETFPAALADLIGEPLTPRIYHAITGRWPDGEGAYAALGDTALAAGTSGSTSQRETTGPDAADLEAARAHYRRYLELAGNGRLEEAGKELQRIGELLGVRPGRGQ